MNNKAQGATNVLTVFVSLAVFIFSAIICAKIGLDFVSQMQGDPLYQSGVANNVFTAINNLPVLFDIGALVGYAFAIVVTIVLARSVVKDIFSYLITWGLSAFFMLIMIIFGYVLKTMLENTLMTDVANNMIFIPFFAEHTGAFAAIYFFITVVSLHVANE